MDTRYLSYESRDISTSVLWRTIWEQTVNRACTGMTRRDLRRSSANKGFIYKLRWIHRLSELPTTCCRCILQASTNRISVVHGVAPLRSHCWMKFIFVQVGLNSRQRFTQGSGLEISVRSRLKFKDVYVRFTRASVRERRHIGSRIPTTLRYVSQSRKKKEKKKKRKRWSCVLARSTRNSVAGFNTLREISGTRVVSKQKIIEWRRIHNIFLAYLEAK